MTTGRIDRCPELGHSRDGGEPMIATAPRTNTRPQFADPVVSTSTEAPEFASLLRRYRLQAGLSQEALGERANLSVRAISALELGERRAPYLATVRALADALDLVGAERGALVG